MKKSWWVLLLLDNNIWAALIVNFLIVEWFLGRPRHEQVSL